ncbi:hypothetical protein SAMN04487971_1227 [Paracoccus chinensis]|uniref:Uncharacterized protein n=1 Tax=Paracoccus chinensis TaxID=525640 RepID=A0A1G9MMC5_9RHOB|nr:hypothetical protein SAMN04487971_1227 [Paracoccus chinensis]
MSSAQKQWGWSLGSDFITPLAARPYPCAAKRRLRTDTGFSARGTAA